MDLRLRPASHSDCILLHSWINDPLARKTGLGTSRVPSEVLKRWLYALSGNKSALCLAADLLVDDRWVRAAQTCINAYGEISISICDGHRGKRLATPIILASLDFAERNPSINKVFARIRCDNIPSIRAFKRAGFRFKAEVNFEDYSYIEYVYELRRMAG